jgi:transcriptional regulator with XRE-family HTH domain
MTAEEFRQRLSALGWSRAKLARRLDVHPNAVSRWAQGHTPVPGYAVAYLNVLDEMQRIGGTCRRVLDNP